MPLKNFYIEELQLKSFKGFNNFTLKCLPVTGLVGLNNSGKTSVLQAIQLVYDIFRWALGGYSNPDNEHPDFVNPQWNSNPSYGLNRLSFGDPDALWLNKRTSIPCNITLKFSDKSEISLEISGRDRYALSIFKNGNSINGSLGESTNQATIENIFALCPMYIPPIGGTSPSESFLTYPQLIEKVNKGAIVECWRAYLYWLCNDGESADFDKVVKVIKRYLPAAIIRPPKLSHENNSGILIEFEQNGVKFDISTSGGGLRTILNLAVVLNFSKSRCLLLDEPDAHLHSTLQHSVSQMLLDHATENDIQVFITSHAPDFISEMPIECLVWIDRAGREGRSCEGMGHFLADLGALTKADAIRAHGSNKILFIEGSLDRKVLLEFIDQYCLDNPKTTNPFHDKTVVVAKLPNGKGDKKYLCAYRNLLRETFSLDVKIISIVDKDYDFPNGNSVEDDGSPLILTLKMKEIENYFLVPELIEKTIKSLAEGRSEQPDAVLSLPTSEVIREKITSLFNEPDVQRTMKCQLIPKHTEGLDKNKDESQKYQEGEAWFEKNWDNFEWKINNCPGKKVLAKLKVWCKEEFAVSLTPHNLIQNLEEYPTDIKESIEKVINFFYGDVKND